MSPLTKKSRVGSAAETLVRFARIEEAIQDIRNGKMVIVVDDEDRENEGDLVMAAEKVTSRAINFMATHGRGLICLPIIGERLDHLQLPAMVPENTSPFETAFAVATRDGRNKNPAIKRAREGKDLARAGRGGLQ